MNGSPMRHVRRLAVIYLAIQAAAVLAWWALLFLAPAHRARFQFGASDASLMAFWLPDLLLIAGGSAVSSYLWKRDSDLAPAVLCLTAGAVLYATLYCLTSALTFDSGWLGFTLMAPAALLTSIFAVALLPNADRLNRQANPASRRYNLVKTTLQTVVFWTTLLVIVPYYIVQLQDRLGIALIAFPAQQGIAVVAFVVCSALGLWSGFTIASRGDGTPLPTDSTRRLVVAGPYTWVRNPMAIAGLGQGLAVALFTGSVLVAAYTLLGSGIWQYIVRPLEEDDLSRRFGAEYDAYRGRVRCWLPRTVPVKVAHEQTS